MVIIYPRVAQGVRAAMAVDTQHGVKAVKRMSPVNSRGISVMNASVLKMNTMNSMNALKIA